MTDLATFGETMLRYTVPRGERLGTAGELSIHVGGAESNVAVAVARLGHEATWLSKLPRSPLARRVDRTITAQGVDTGVIWTDEGRQGVYYLEPGGEPRGTEVVYDRSHAAVRTATPDELATGSIREADVFYTSGITPALSPTLADTSAALFEAARADDTTTVLDVNYRSKLWSPEDARETLERLLPLVDLLVVSDRDAGSVFDRTGDPDAVASAFLENHDHDAVVVTRGDRGAVALTADGRYEQSTFEAETRDPVGTGDAFVGGFLARWLDGAGIDAALEYGAATAAVKRTLDGDMALVSPEDVENVIDAGERPIDR